MKRAKLTAHQFKHRMTDLREHSPHDVISPRVDLDLDHRLTRRRSTDDLGLVCRDRSVIQFDPGGQQVQCSTRDIALHLGDVRLRDAERGMREHVSEIPVIGENEQTAGLRVEPRPTLKTRSS